MRQMKLGVMFAITTLVATSLSLGAQASAELTEQDVDRWMTELSNWGRWGKDDQLGAVNLITPQKRKQAAALVREGISISLARPLDKEKAVDNPNPLEHVMIRNGIDHPDRSSADSYSISYHGGVHTHLDALSHFYHRGKMYNGFSQQEVTREGAAKLDVLTLQDGILTRAVLIDLPRLKGVPYLEAGIPIYPEDLEAWEKKTGVRVSSGDVVLVRTGRWVRRAAVGPFTSASGMAGLHASSARWFRQRDVAMVGTDGVTDVRPSGIEDSVFPLHRLLLVGMGVHILDNLDLDELSRTAARLDRWDFLLTLGPMPVEGGTGAPVNPIATF
ncbi:MAG: cyclase family protein [candidate division NC10 bacterium]